MTKDELDEILEKHEAWLQGEDGGERADLRNADLPHANLRGADLRRANLRRANLRDANLRDANLRHADLRDANLRDADLRDANLRHADLRRANLRDADLRHADLRHADLRHADLRRANLRDADLRDANLRRANLRDADLRDADLRDANLSGATGLLSQSEWMADQLEQSEDGYIAYKQFGNYHDAPEHWSIEQGAVLEEVVNPCRAVNCGCGVNVAVKAWDDFEAGKITWRVLIRWEWLPGVVVPYNTDGKFRCERVELIEEVNE